MLKLLPNVLSPMTAELFSDMKINTKVKQHIPNNSTTLIDLYEKEAKLIQSISYKLS